MLKSLNDYKAEISSAIQNNAVNQLIAELAAHCVENDTLKAELEALKTPSGATAEPQKQP